MTQVVTLSLADDRRPRAHHAHIPAQNIQKLRQFVEGVLTQETAKGRDARVVADLEQHSIALVHVQNLSPATFRVSNHGAKFKTPKDPGLLPDAIRAIEDGPGRLELNRSGDRQQ